MIGLPPLVRRPVANQACSLSFFHVEKCEFEIWLFSDIRRGLKPEIALTACSYLFICLGWAMVVFQDEPQSTDGKS